MPLKNLKKYIQIIGLSILILLPFQNCSSDFEIKNGLLSDSGALAVTSPTGAPVPTLTCPEPKAILKGNTFYVSVTGSNCNPGTLDQPFATISQCTTSLSGLGGGTCLLMAGVYHETVVVPSHTQIAAYSTQSKADIPVVTGLETLSADLAWVSVETNIWKAPVDLLSNNSRFSSEDIQVFVDGDVPLLDARWPNIKSVENLLDGAGSTAKAGTKMSDGIHGEIVDSALPKGVDLTGAIVQVRGGLNWGTHTGVITKSSAGRISYTADGGAVISALRVDPGSRYVVVRSRALLDTSSEFFYDQAAKELYLFSADSPSLHKIRVKMREWAFDLSNTQNSSVSNVSVLAASIKMSDQSANNKLDRLNISYFSHYTRSMKGAFMGMGTDVGVQLWGQNNTLSNSVLHHSAGNGVTLKGSGHTLLNNKISFTDYMGVYNTSVFIIADANRKATGMRILHNTLSMTGRDSIQFTSGKAAPSGDEFLGGSLADSQISFNDISTFGKLTQDLGGIYICCNVDGTHWVNSQPTTRTAISHNVIHDSGRRTAQNGGSGATGIFLDNETHGFAISHNVIFSMGDVNGTDAGGGSAIQINGFRPSGNPGHNYDNTINSNTILSGQKYSIKVLAQDGGGLSKTVISNNIFAVPMYGLNTANNCSSGLCDIGNQFGVGGGHNYYGNPGFVNATQTPFDFHLSGASSLIQSAPALWTDTNPVNSLCASGQSCASPVTPSYGAVNTGGFSFTAGSDLK